MNLMSAGCQVPPSQAGHTSKFTVPGSPFGAIPPDILYLVTMVLVSEPEDLSWVLTSSDIFRSAALDSNHWLPQLALSHVCRHWRLTISAYPTLWSFIRIRRTCHPRLLKDVWLPRARGADLHIRISDMQQWQLDRKGGGVLNVLLPTASRWREIVVRRCAYAVVGRVIATLKAAQPLAKLETCFLSRRNQPHHPELPLLPEFFPNIAKLEGCCCLLPLEPSSFRVWAHSLKEIRLHDAHCKSSGRHFEPSLIYHLLEQTCHNLEVLSLQFVLGRMPVNWPPRRRLYFPKLRELEFPEPPATWNQYSLPQVGPLLEVLQAPILSSIPKLSLTLLPTLADANPFPGIQSLFLRNRQSPWGRHATRRLKFARLGDALARLRFLRTISFAGCQWTCAVYAVPLSTHCPVLAKIVFEECGGLYVEDVKQMVLDRERNAALGLAPFETLHFVRSHFVLGPDDEAWFGAHLSKGVVIKEPVVHREQMMCSEPDSEGSE